MGISVISNIAAKIAPAASAAAPAAANGLPGDFAALLSGQGLAATMSSLIAGNTDAKNIGLPATGTDWLDNEALPDPSILAAMIGIPPLKPTIAQGQQAEHSASKDQGNAISGDILTALGGRPPQMSEGPGAQLMEKEVSGSASALPTLDTERQLAGLTREAANIAADIPADSAPIANFNAAMATASMQREVAAKQTTVNTPLTSDAWAGQFSEKIVWVAKNDLQTAQININPPQLGPIQITLNLDGNQANAIFASPHAEVRQALEAAVPQLREMLANAGISLGDANVGSNLAQQNPDTPFLAANKNQSRHENAILPATENVAGTGTSQVLRRGRGLVDLFA